MYFLIRWKFKSSLCGSINLMCKTRITCMLHGITCGMFLEYIFTSKIEARKFKAIVKICFMYMFFSF